MRDKITFPARFDRRERCGPGSVIDWVLQWGIVSYTRTSLEDYAFIQDPTLHTEMVYYVIGWPTR